MNVVVSGARRQRYAVPVREVLDRVHRDTPVTHLHHGGAVGVDTIAHGWAVEHGVTVTVHPADWERYGRAAGPIRNNLMLDVGPDYWVAFPDVDSKGTRQFIGEAQRRGLPGEVVELT